MKIKIKKLSETAKIPTRAYEYDAGFDLYANEDVFVGRGFTRTVSTGLAIEIPEGFYGRIVGRSSINSNTGLRVLEGIIDSGYRGEIKIMVDYVKKNTKFKKYEENVKHAYQVLEGDKIAQLIIQPLPEFEVEEVDKLSESERGTGGFGSSD